MKLIFKMLNKIRWFWHTEYSFVKSVIVLVLMLSFVSTKAQIQMPNMLVSKGTWGLIDVNNLYGGCMQVDTHAKMLLTDVQYLKRGMIFVVYDDDAVKPGAQTRVYVFIPQVTGVKSWPFNSPFDIPQTKQNLNIITAGLSNFLFPLNITTNTDPGNKSNVYFDTTTNQFYRFDDSTDPATYVVITPKAEYISVVAQNGITSTNVQAALEELKSNGSSTDQRFEGEVQVDGELQTISLSFDLKNNSMVYYNGVLLEFNKQWKMGATAKDFQLLLATMAFDKIRIQR